MVRLACFCSLDADPAEKLQHEDTLFSFLCRAGRCKNTFPLGFHGEKSYLWEQLGCIKLHAAIDVIIRNNYLVNGYNGLWLDWQAIGTRVSCNIFENNDHTDLWTEVTHGPCLVDNNIFLSPNTFFDWGQGVCFTHNIISGYITSHPVSNRYTPYHYPHSTKVVGVMTRN